MTKSILGIVNSIGETPNSSLEEHAFATKVFQCMDLLTKIYMTQRQVYQQVAGHHPEEGEVSTARQ